MHLFIDVYVFFAIIVIFDCFFVWIFGFLEQLALTPLAGSIGTETWNDPDLNHLVVASFEGVPRFIPKARVIPY